jgi:Ala-tRNA(Pro) deacylase
MAIAMTLRDYLSNHHVDYDVIFHPKSHNSIHAAKLAHVPADRVAKSVILEDDDGYLMAVIPSSNHVKLGTLSRELRRQLRLATEPELSELFGDCQVGAIPPIGTAYGMQMIFDEALAQQPDLYFEAGDHEELIHVDTRDFMGMMTEAQRGRFSQPIAGEAPSGIAGTTQTAFGFYYGA